LNQYRDNRQDAFTQQMMQARLQLLERPAQERKELQLGLDVTEPLIRMLASSRSSQEKKDNTVVCLTAICSGLSSMAASLFGDKRANEVSLSMARAIVEMLENRITHDTEPKLKTTFKVDAGEF
jgi:hypothetical protein